ncbi:tetratricopeptide repeat protein [Sphaerisporangium sp. B11E5]|uniref:tetratricopeptide repeat protein n=1 Tax=Sphaerisporangium sp. B11E5 TaxID=3153563 RepID=UPI00325EA627
MLSIRDIELLTGIPASTLGGYFAGRHLPALKSGNLPKILRACGLRDLTDIDRWLSALGRLRRGEPSTPASDEGPSSPLPLPEQADLVSTRPPIERLRQEPAIRGRDSLLALLGRGLGHGAPRNGHRVHILHGLGGVGKSTIALELARRSLRTGVRTWWIAADGSAGVAGGMQALAADLGAVREVMRVGSAPDVVWRLLNLYRRPWLLIIDNADDPEHDLALDGGPVTDAPGWLRPVEGRYGTVLVTSRQGDPAIWGSARGSWVRLHRVGSLSAADGGQVLHELAGTRAGTLPEATTLAERLAGLPLALRLAGSHLSQAALLPATLAGPATYTEYARALDAGMHEEVLVGERPAGRGARQLVGHTWELSLQSLDARGVTYARPLLRLLSCLRPAPVPYGILLYVEELAQSALFPAITGRELRDALSGLAGVGLLELMRTPDAEDDVAHTSTIHPLVRELGLRHPDLRDHVNDYLVLLTSVLTRIAEKLNPSDPASWSHWRVLADHCMSPLDLLRQCPFAQPPSQALRPATLAARYLRAAGRLAQAAGRYEDALAVGRTIFSPDHPAILTLDHDLNRVTAALGRLEQAERGFRRVLEARVRTLGDDHPDSLTTRHYLARTLRNIGRRDEAESLFVDTLRSRERVLGPTHPHTLTSRNNLADLRRAQGRLDEARRRLREVLRARREFLGDDYPATLITRHYLAKVDQDAGDLVAADTELADLARTAGRVLGPEHPRTLGILHSLAEVRQSLGHTVEAVSLFRQVLESRVHVLGEDHPATAATRARLARLQRYA